MKKLWPLALLLISSIANAGTTALTATVQDATGQAFANGTVKAEFFPNGLPGPYLTNGSTFPTTVTGVLDGTGTFTMTVTDNNTIQPFGTKWKFTVCSNTSAPCSTSVQTVTGATQNLSSSISNDMAVIFVPGNVVPTAYQDSEVGNKNVTLYYNVTNGSFRYWSGIWQTISGGGGGGSVNINGTLVNNPNFNNTNPIAQANFINCVWQLNSPNVSVECPFGTTGTTFVVGNDNRILGAAQQQANNTFTATNVFATATLQLPLQPGYAPTVQGFFGLDNTNFLLKIGLNGSTGILPYVIGSAPTGCAQWTTNFQLTGTGVACGSGGGAGTVISVGLSQTGSFFNITNTPVTTSGNINIGFANEAAGTVFGNSTGGSAVPTFFVPTTSLLSDFPTQATHAGQFLTTNGTTLSWASPSGSGTVNSGTQFCLAWYATAGTAVSSLSRLCENAGATQLTYTGTAGFAAPVLTATGAVSGALALSGSTSGTATIQVGSAAGNPTWTLSTANGVGIWHEQAGGQLASAAVGLNSADVTGILQGANGGTGVSSTAIYPSSGTINTGTGTANIIPKWTGTTTEANSGITDNGTTISTSESIDFSAAAHTKPVVVGTTAAITALSCSAGEMGFSTNATAGQNVYLCTATNTWTQLVGGGGGGGANTALSNLAAVAINLDLLPGSAAGISLGSAALPVKYIFMAGDSTTPTVNNYKLTGTATAARTLTFPDQTGIFVLTPTTANAGFLSMAQGTDNCVTNQPVNSVCLEAPTSIATSYHILLPGAGASGILRWAFATATATTSVSELSGDVTTSGSNVTSVVAFHFGATQQTLSSTAPTTNQCLAYNGTNIIGTTCGGSAALSSVTAAIASNTLANGNNPQTWNWAQTTATQTGMAFGETTAATGGTTAQFLVSISTLSSSTSVPLLISNSLSGSQTLPTLKITPTWNTTGVVDAALLVNITNTASGAGSLIADFQLGGTSIAKLDKAGNLTLAGTPAGYVAFTQGPANSAGTTNITFQAPTAVTSYVLTLPGSASSGEAVYSNNAGTITQSWSGDTNHSKHLTAQTAAIGATTVCPTTAGVACGEAGLYNVSGYIVSTVTCATPGPAVAGIQLSWTDAASAKTTVAVPLSTDASSTATAATIALGTVGTHYGFFNQVVWSTGGAAIQYATTYTACTSGTGTYELDLAVERLQ